MADRIEELMDANLRRVFGERDPNAGGWRSRTPTPGTSCSPTPRRPCRAGTRCTARPRGCSTAPPGFAFSADGPIRRAQDLALLAWQFGPPGQDPVVRGIDVAEIREERIARLWTVLVPD